MRPLATVLAVVMLACAALPVMAETRMAWKADEIWVVRNGVIVHKAPINDAPQLAVLNRRGQIYVFGCPPQPEQPETPPPFDFPDDPPETEPTPPDTELAPPSDVSPAFVAMLIAALVGGVAAGYVGTRPSKIVPLDDDEDDDVPIDPETL